MIKINFFRILTEVFQQFRVLTQETKKKNSEIPVNILAGYFFISWQIDLKVYMEMKNT